MAKPKLRNEDEVLFQYSLVNKFLLRYYRERIGISVTFRIDSGQFFINRVRSQYFPYNTEIIRVKHSQKLTCTRWIEIVDSIEDKFNTILQLIELDDYKKIKVIFHVV